MYSNAATAGAAVDVIPKRRDNLELLALWGITRAKDKVPDASRTPNVPRISRQVDFHVVQTERFCCMPPRTSLKF